MEGFNNTMALPKILSGEVYLAGAGVTGRSMVKLLLPLGVNITIVDNNSTARAAVAEEFGIAELSTERAAARFEQVSSVITSPGWPPHTPLFQAAAAAGVPVLGDIELCYLLDHAEVFGPKRTWLAVTGTNGKTTTTSMLYAMMQEHGVNVAAVGNIGIGVADAIAAPERIDALVVELSSFQLHWSSQLRPDVGVLLNLAEDHIDWHGSMAEYIAAKAKILTAATAIAGTDDPLVAQQVADLPHVYSFGLSKPQKNHVGVVNDALVDNAFADNLTLASTIGIEPAGQAGVYDALAAAAAARAVGVTPDAIARALAGFRVAAHRGQVVASIGGVTALDNSKATNPHAADSALAGHDSVIWIAGGQLKGADIVPVIKKHKDSLKAVALLGEDRYVIAEALSVAEVEALVMVTDATDPAQAMSEVCAFAAQQSEPGDAIILAPAAASLDMYTGMAQRGDMFAESITAHLGDFYRLND